MKSLLLITTLALLAGCSCLQNGAQKEFDPYGEEPVENPELVTLKGKPITLVGKTVKEDQMAPDFVVVDKDFKPVRLEDFKGQLILISTVPSLDTQVCQVQTAKFHEEIAKLEGEPVILTISADLPFAQKRFCGVKSVKQNQVYSDAVWHDFAKNYGLFVKGRGLLARSVIIIDGTGTVIHFELVEEITEEPDYETALTIYKTLLEHYSQ